VEVLEGLGLPLVLLAVLYLFLIRPQQRRRREQQRMLAALAVGDPVVTIGGLHGEVLALDPTTVDLVVTYDDDGVTPDVVLRFDRSSIARVDAQAEAASTDGDGPAA
jgi:preprotein translocase subunit YajC